MTKSTSKNEVHNTNNATNKNESNSTFATLNRNTSIHNSIDITKDRARYDNACKLLLSEKIILAWIMQSTMTEYADIPVQTIASDYISGKPTISTVPVAQDESQDSSRITSEGTEDSSINEGVITYDIRFRAITPDSLELIGLIINIEPQNDFYPGYPIVKRGIYYCSRLISAQYGTEFTESHYENIKKVYSIWICMNPPAYRENTITKYHMSEAHIVGNVIEDVSNYDLLTTMMVCLGNSNSVDNDLLKMLDILFKEPIPAAVKKQRLEEEFQIPMTYEVERKVTDMGHVTDEFMQQGKIEGRAEGKAEGKAEGIIGILNELGTPEEEIVTQLITRLQISSDKAWEYLNKTLMSSNI